MNLSINATWPPEEWKEKDKRYMNRLKADIDEFQKFYLGVLLQNDPEWADLNYKIVELLQREYDECERELKCVNAGQSRKASPSIAW